MASNNSTATPDNKTIIDDITIGVVVILIGAIVYIGWILYKRRRRRRRKRNRKGSESVLEPMVEMEEMNIETPPKKTAADHLGELREVTQKVLQPLRISSSFSSPKENLSTVLSSGSSVSSNNTKRDNKISTLKDSLIFKPFKVPSPPPPSPLRNDDIKVEPIRLSLLNLLLSNKSTNTSSSISSPIVDSSSDLSIPTETNSKNDSLRSLRKTLSKSQSDLSNISRTVTTLPRETNSKKNLLRKSISNSHPDLKDLSRKKLPQLDLTSPPKIHSKKGPLSQLDLTPSSRTIPQLNSTIPSESRYKWDLKRTTPILDSKVQSKRSNRQTYSRNKETNDYTNFQPIQNIKPVQNAQSEQTAKITKIVETEEVEELTLSPMYRIVKPVLKKERQDDEIILDATLE